MNIGPDVKHQSPAQSIEQLKLQLASELAPARWRSPLTRFSKRLSSGQEWTSSINSANLPTSLANLLHAVSFTPDPVQTLSDLLRSRRGFKTVASKLVPLVYPTSILVATFLLTSLVAWIGWSTTKSVDWYDWTRGNRTIDTIPRLFQSQLARSIAATSVVGWLLLIGVILRCMAPRLMRLSLLIHLPWFGKLYRWSMFRDLSNTLAVLLKTGITTEHAVEGLVFSVQGSLLEIPAKGLQKRIGDGKSIEQAIRDSMLCDEFLRPATQRLFDAQHDTATRVQELSYLANRLFEQRTSALSSTATRVCLLLVLCMYARMGVDICLVLQGINGSLASLDFFGSSENWFLLLPIAVVNFVFLHAMFRMFQSKPSTGIVSTIMLFAATCFAIALVGLTLRCTLVDIVYAVPLSMVIAAMRRNNSEMRYFAASQALLSGAGESSNSEKIATELIAENRGGVRRRVRRFAKQMSKGVSCEAALSRSRLVTDHQQRWLVALIARFDKMEESKSILAMQSPWSDLRDQLLDRLNGLKWMSIIFAIGIAFIVSLTTLVLWPMTNQLFTEMQDPIINAISKWDFSSPFAEKILIFIYYDLSAPIYSYSGSLFLVVAFFIYMSVQWIPGLKLWLISVWMAPAYRAWTLRGIGEALESDFRISHVLTESSKIHPIMRQRASLRSIVNDLERGISVQEAFAKRGMIRWSQRGMLSLAKEPRQLAWALRQIATRNYFRWMEWYLMLVDLATILIVVIAATIVGFIAYVEFYLLATFVIMGVPQ